MGREREETAPVQEPEPGDDLDRMRGRVCGTAEDGRNGTEEESNQGAVLITKKKKEPYCNHITLFTNRLGLLLINCSFLLRASRFRAAKFQISRLASR